MKRALGFLFWLALVAGAWGQDPARLVEHQMVDYCNEQRRLYGLPPLAIEVRLETAARAHSEEMANLQYFDHISPDPRQRYPWDRVNAVGADSESIAENLYFAEGYELAELARSAVVAWMSSPEHRHNLLSNTFSHVGIGLARRGKQIYVTQVFSAAMKRYR